MTYHDTDTPDRTVSGIDGYVADVIVVQHTPRGVSVTRAGANRRNASQAPPRR